MEGDRTPAAEGSVAEWTPADWEELLGQELGHPVRVLYGRSRTVPVQARGQRLPGGGGLEVRLHRMFAVAPAQVREDLARWLRVGRRARRACERLDGWIEQALAELPPPTRRRPTLAPTGHAYDLEAMAEPLWGGEFARDFVERPRPGLTWGRRQRSSSRRSLRLGSYDPELNVVRVHPVLDQEGVPEWFVRFVLMHEILHAALPPRRGRGRRWIHHGAEFRRRERAFEEHAPALVWEERNLGRLIRSARTGERFVPARGSLAELFRGRS